MNFKPILFSTPMVQAILNGTKVQTRRIIKPQPKEGYTPRIYKGNDMRMHLECRKSPVELQFDTWKVLEKGDVLWVRESFYQYGFWRKNGLTKTGKQKWKFIADNAYTSIAYNDNPPSSIFKNSQRVLGWYKRSSLFMPKEACRLFLKIKDIRVERLQDISEQDAIAEGAQHGRYVGLGQIGGSHKEGFFILWEKINGQKSLISNPWVWVIEFERIEKPEGFC